jgi:sugar phosphate isomerase/epimerase
MIFGICVGPENSSLAADAGFDFLEINVPAVLKPSEPEQAFLTEFKKIEESVLPCLIANCFIPADCPITGPQADISKLTRYVGIAAKRAHRAGVKTIVFGSGGARRIPDNFDRTIAIRQLIDFGVIAATAARTYDIVIAVEPLNKNECNVFTTIGECADYVRKINNPSFRLLLDTFHFTAEQDSFDLLKMNMSLFQHVHVATFPSRRAPAAEPCDFSLFFDILKKYHYTGSVSIECKWEDLAKEAPTALKELKRLSE